MDDDDEMRGPEFQAEDDGYAQLEPSSRLYAHQYEETSDHSGIARSEGSAVSSDGAAGDEEEDEHLTALERIFLFAKSEHVDHRETVSRMLPTWLEDVEICEAVEYILPLFVGLAQDEHTVRDALAQNLSSCIWYYLSVSNRTTPLDAESAMRTDAMLIACISDAP